MIGETRAESRPRRLIVAETTGALRDEARTILRALTSTEVPWQITVACPDGPFARCVRDTPLEWSELPEVRRSARSAARALRAVARGADVVLLVGVEALQLLERGRLDAPVALLVEDVLVGRDCRVTLRLTRYVDLAIATSDAAATPLSWQGVTTRVVRTAAVPSTGTGRRDAAPRVIGCGTRMTKGGGHDVLLDAVARLRRDDVEVELIGTGTGADPTVESALRARASRPDLAGHVHFLDGTVDLGRVVDRWHVAVAPDVHPAGAPLAIVEAMGHGVPVVATDHGGVAEVLDDAGILVRPGRADHIADALARLLDDNELCGRYATAGRARVAAELNAPTRDAELLDALEECAESGRVKRAGQIVFVVPDYEPTMGGTTRQTENQARELAARGHNVVVVTQRLDLRWAREERSGGLPIRRLHPSGRSPLRMKLLVLSVALWLRRRRRHIAIVHVIMYPDFVVSSALAGLAHRTVMCWAGLGDATDTLGKSSVGRLPLRAIRRRALARAAQVALTPALREELATLGLDRDVTVVPTPVDTDHYRPPTAQERDAARSSLSVAPNEFAIVYTGHLRALKRVELLVNAFAGLARDTPARLFLIGGSRASLEDRTDALREQVSLLGLDSQVVITGGVADVRHYLHAADVLVLPSDREGLPNSILEALACGVPVVAPPSAAGDQVLDDSCGIVPPSNAPEHLQAALATLAGDPALRQQLASGARIAAERFALRQVGERYEALYARLTRHGDGGAMENAESGTRHDGIDDERPTR